MEHRDDKSSLNSGQEIAAKKSALRAKIGTELQSLSKEDKASASKRVCEELENIPEYRDSRLVLFYSALSSEVSLNALAKRTLASGKDVCLPRYDLKTSHLVLHKINSWDEDLISGAWNILEPKECCPVEQPSMPDLIFVPGVAFDKDGYRLGRGKGLYDRLLATTCGVTIGICFKTQMVEQVPRENFDVPVGRVIAA